MKKTMPNFLTKNYKSQDSTTLINQAVTTGLDLSKKNPLKCSLCHQPGHNARTCKLRSNIANNKEQTTNNIKPTIEKLNPKTSYTEKDLPMLQILFLTDNINTKSMLIKAVTPIQTSKHFK